MFDFTSMNFNPEELKRLHDKQQEANETWTDKDKLAEVANKIAERIAQIPNLSRERMLGDDVVNLTMLTMALIHDLGISKSTAMNPLFAMKITQIMAVTYLLGVQKGMKEDDIPDCFKDIFNKG